MPESPSRTIGSAASADPVRFTLVLACVLVVARLIASCFIPLVPQEAYYWMYARHPQLSYFDHPPMIAWLIQLGTLAFGNTEFGVRVMGQLLMLAASVCLYRWSRLWYGRRVSLIAALILQIMPIFFALGFIATMDAGLIFFWIAALLGFGLAVQGGRPAGWYLAGVAVGAAMLTKYTAAFLPAGFLIALACYGPWRRHLRSIHPWAALTLAGLMFWPVITWNHRHDWASFRFQFAGRFDSENNPHPGLHYFVGEQFLVLTPFIFFMLPIMLAHACRHGRAIRSPRVLVALAFSLPMFSVMTFSAIRHDVHINWTAPLYLSVVPFAVHTIKARARRAARAGRKGRLIAGAKATVLLGGAVNLAALLVMLCLRLFSPYISSPFGPWKPLAREVDRQADLLERQNGVEPLVIGQGKFELASELAFYGGTSGGDRPFATTTSQWILDESDGIGFRYWLKREDWVGRDCIVVGPSKFLRRQTAPWFDSVVIFEMPAIHLEHPMSIAVCRGLRQERRGPR